MSLKLVCPSSAADHDDRSADTVVSAQIERDGGVAWLRLAGRLDAARGPELTRELRLAQMAARLIVLDLRPLSSIDTTCVGIIARAGLRARRGNRRLILVRAPEAVDRAFALIAYSERPAIVDLARSGTLRVELLVGDASAKEIATRKSADANGAEARTTRFSWRVLAMARRPSAQRMFTVTRRKEIRCTPPNAASWRKMMLGDWEMPSSFQLNPVRNQLRHHSSMTHKAAAAKAWRSAAEEVSPGFRSISRATRRNQMAG